VIDVSFISLKLVLPAVVKLMARPARLLALIKPQFETGRRYLKKGIVRDESIHAAVCEAVAGFVASLDWQVAGLFPSPITGADGNREFFIAAERD
jgi:23S rRNA (cytidine1920-2'-O)/16S rRNA (cytidine1409-2'-O)-methyltransferase